MPPSLAAIVPFLLVLLPASAALAQARQVEAEISHLEERAEACAAIASALDFKIEQIDTVLPGLRGLGPDSRTALRRELTKARETLALADGCDDELTGLSERIGAMIGDTAGNSATGNEMLALIAMEARFDAARRTIDASYGGERHRDRRALLEWVEARAGTLLE